VNILLVEDDKSIALGLEYSLSQEGYTVELAVTAKQAKELINDKHSLVLLDLELPDENGFEVCKHIRSSYNTPIIFLTAYDDEVNVIMGLDLGADDYITKPFRVGELISRINSVLRRYKGNQVQKTIKLHNLEIDTTSAQVKKNGQDVQLTALEYKLLLTLLNNKEQVLTRNQILDYIWDESGNFVTDNALTVYIKRLREKIEDNPQEPKIIHTVRGLGYKLESKNDV